MANNAKMTNLQLLLSAGINPKNGLPYRNEGEEKVMLKDNIRRCLRVLDEQTAINRFVWYNLPSGLTGQLLERILYYKGQGMFFYSPTDDKFYFLPYALAGTINVYGEFKKVAGLPFNGTLEDKPIEAFTRDVVLDIEDDIENAFEDGCVLLSDYSKQISQTNIPRQLLQEPILDAEAEAFPFARTSLIAHSGVKGMRVGSDDESANVKVASRSITKAALCGDPWVPITGAIDFQELTDGSPLKSEEYLVYMQALDNFRLSLYGLDNGGLFDKKAYVNNQTAGAIQSNVGLVMQDGLTNRQHFCDIVNSIWGLGIWCELSETVTNTDTNLDGVVSDSKQPTVVENQGGQEDGRDAS